MKVPKKISNLQNRIFGVHLQRQTSGLAWPGQPFQGILIPAVALHDKILYFGVFTYEWRQFFMKLPSKQIVVFN